MTVYNDLIYQLAWLPLLEMVHFAFAGTPDDLTAQSGLRLLGERVLPGLII